MHRETISSLIDSGAGAVGAFLKEAFVHQKEMERMEAEKDKQIELARIRNQNGNPERREEVVESVTEHEGEPTAAEMQEAIDELIEAEDCSVCQQLLVGLKELPVRDQVIGVMEYGTFKNRLDQEADVDELKAEIEKTEVLERVLERQFA